jgi:L-alanine-DL-glutamate epimerase-like enolase superfamily enzyme
MTIAVTQTAFHVIDLETRLPFHFGNVEITEIPKVFLRAEVNVDGESQVGVAMGGLIPSWFYKDPEMRLQAGYRNMVAAFRSAADIATNLDPEPTAFAFWRSLYDRQREWADGTDHPPLLWSYGVSLVEQALLDAVCRAKDVSFASAVRKNLLGIDLGSVYDELAPYEPADLLPAEPSRTTAIRHTVGLGDPLTDADVTGERPDDDLPLTLAEYVREDGVTYFKIKLTADRGTDAVRLARIADVLADLDVEEYRCTVDANEGYGSAEEFRRQWEDLQSDSDCADVFNHLAYVEQPLPRDEALTPETRDVFTSWKDAPPIIIDESDARIDSAGAALSHGYAGTSHKNCKGALKGIINACLVAHRNRNDDDDRKYVISAEDLTTGGPVELLQDFAVAATIGVNHVERNGHHYFRGLDAFPDEIQRTVLSAHGDLYRRHEEDFATLRIADGALDLSTTVNAPFGVAPLFDTRQFQPLEEWTRALAE